MPLSREIDRHTYIYIHIHTHTYTCMSIALAFFRRLNYSWPGYSALGFWVWVLGCRVMDQKKVVLPEGQRI